MEAWVGSLNESVTKTIMGSAIYPSELWDRTSVKECESGACHIRNSQNMAWDESVTDEQLMLACQKGRDDALEEIYRRHFRMIFLFIVRLVQKKELAEDLAQETFFRVYVNRDSWQPQAKFTSWLYRIARNLCIDEKRRYWNRMVQTESQLSSDDYTDVPYLDRVEDDRGDAHDAFKAKMNEETIKQAINQLSDEQREVIILNKYQGLSYSEIAEILGSSAESIKQRAYRAHLKLRGILEPLLEEYH